MPRVSAAFFAFGALCLLTGMIMGMRMGASGDFTLMPAHAHLNLLGWVTMSLYGAFYALTRETMSCKLAWTNFGLSAAGVLVMIPFLAMMLKSGDHALEKYVAIGGGISMLGLIVFGVSVVKELIRPR
ncbi:MAG TPA: hypothetical protein VJ798_00665 [Rhizomicrobium sp.]|nr:hypothetical protein [Rhizomicrobium sp.]